VQIDIEGVRWSGQTTATGITLLIPDSHGKLDSHAFKVATSDDYSSAVSRLGGSVVAARATATVHQQQQIDAQATAAARAKAQLDALRQQSCAAIGGHIATAADKADPPGDCASNLSGSVSGKPGADCEFASVTFESDGAIRKSAYDVSKLFYPGCFN
jgi:hypothetical protein